MDIFDAPLLNKTKENQEQQQNQQESNLFHDHDLIKLSSSSELNKLIEPIEVTSSSIAPTTQTITNNVIIQSIKSNINQLNGINNSLSQNSNSSGYQSGRSTPNTLLNRLNNNIKAPNSNINNNTNPFMTSTSTQPLQQQQQQASSSSLSQASILSSLQQQTSLDDYLFDNELLLINKQVPKYHQQQLQLLNDEIQSYTQQQNRLYSIQQQQQQPKSISLQQQQPLTNTYRSLSLNNVILQSPTHQPYTPTTTTTTTTLYQPNNYYNQSSQLPLFVNTNNNNTVSNMNRRERSLDRNIASLISNTSSSLNRHRSLSVNKNHNRYNSDDLNVNIKHDLSANSIKSLIQQHTQTLPLMNGGNSSGFNGSGSVNSSSSNNNKLNIIKDLQIKLIDTQKDIYYLKCELELANQKLNSSIHSIKTFWSPELKRERQLRKEETIKYQNLYEKYKILLSTSTHTTTTTTGHDLHISLSSSPLAANTHENLQDLQQQQPHNTSLSSSSSSLLNINKHIKENNLLKKTINELELRIDSQKQTINTKDETIKNLFVLLNNSNKEAQKQQQQQIFIDTTSSSNTNEFNELKDSLNNTIEQQTQHIKFIENQNQLLQDELKIMQQTQSTASTISLNNNLTTQNQIELYKSNEKFFKEKIEALKFEINRKDNEFQTLRTKYESIESKEKDLQHYLNLLKESISTKDQQILIVQSETNDLRTRLRDKEAIIEKKTQQIQNYQLDKHQRDSDLLELRDQMDIKERKLNVLNRKIDNLEEQLKDKELQIQTLRAKLNVSSVSAANAAILSHSSSNAIGAGSVSSGPTLIHNNLNTNELTNLEQMIDDKEKLIDKLTKNNRETVDSLNATIQELKEFNAKKDKEIVDYQNELLDLKDEINILKTQLIHKDSHVNSLELSLTQKNDEIEQIEEKFTRLKQQQQYTSTQFDTSKKQVIQLQKELQLKEQQLTETFKELNILKDLISNFELQKDEMMNKLEQQQQVFENLQIKYEQQVKQQQEQQLQFQQQQQQQHYHQIERQNTDESTSDDGKFERINELEDALRQSVAITAEREIVMAKQKSRLEKVENENKTLTNDIEKMKKFLNEQQFQFERLQQDFIKREEQLQQLEEEKVKEMNELLIAKQEALLAAISEKDANIGQLEVDNNKTSMHEINRLYEEKDNLHQQLKELNEKRMKLMQEHLSTKDAKDKVKAIVLGIKTANDEDGLYA